MTWLYMSLNYWCRLLSATTEKSWYGTEWNITGSSLCEVQMMAAEQDLSGAQLNIPEVN